MVDRVCPNWMLNGPVVSRFPLMDIVLIPQVVAVEVEVSFPNFEIFESDSSG